MESKNVKMPNVLRAKVAVVGEPQVGKTSMCNQLTSDGTNFPKNYLLTHLMEIHVKSINIPDTNNIVELYLNDCSGKETYTELLGECWKDTALIVAMYDVCREDTFGTVARWVEQVTAKANSGEDKRLLPGVLLANKSDLSERRVVSPKLGSELAQQLGLMYFECSCKDYNGVEEPFYYLANEYHKAHGDKIEQMANFA